MSNSPNGSTHSSSGRDNPTGTSKRRNSKDSPMPFYEMPSWLSNVPSKIINQVKQELVQPRDLPTTRPYTPRDDSRHTLSKLRHNPSFNASSVDYETESRPSSGHLPSETRRRNSQDSSGARSEVPIPTAAPPLRLSKLHHQPERQPHTSESTAPTQAKPPLPPHHQHSSGASTSLTSTTGRSSHHRTSSIVSKEESTDEVLVWTHEIGPLIETLLTAYKKRHFEQFDRTSEDLYIALSKNNLFARKNSKRRTELLKQLFTFIECEHPIVKYHVARLSLAFQVSSANNLRNIVRLTADLSSNKENDRLFLNSNLLDLLFDTMTRVEIGANLEAIAYFCTTLKNLTINNELMILISDKNPMELLKTILKSLLQLKDQTAVLDRLRDCLIPLTDTLRNLADNDLNRRHFLTDDLIDHLAHVLKYFTDKSDSDLMKNVARILSKLTQHTDCCLKLVQCPSCYRSFLKILMKHESNQAIVVRVCFILGNMMAKSEDARLTFMSDSRALHILTKLLNSYVQLDSLILKPEKFDTEETTNHDPDAVDDSNNSSNALRSCENVINKVIRVLSNLAISEENGLAIIRRDDCIDLLFKILNAPKQHSEELLVHVLMALNNLSYYDDAQSYIIRHAESLAQLLVKYIRNDEKMDCVIEAFRVLGNLSRTKRIRDVLVMCKVDRLAIHHCNSDNVELLYAVIGVLINLTVDEDKRACLKVYHGLDSLINIFEYSSHSDWQLCSLVCKALWNYCDDNYETNGPTRLWFTDDQLKKLLTLFDGSLHEDNLDPTDDPELDNLNRQLWNEEYYPVASRLHQRLIDGIEDLQANIMS